MHGKHSPFQVKDGMGIYMILCWCIEAAKNKSEITNLEPSAGEVLVEIGKTQERKQFCHFVHKKEFTRA